MSEDKTITIPADKLVSITIKEREDSEDNDKPEVEKTDKEKKDGKKKVDIREED